MRKHLEKFFAEYNYPKNSTEALLLAYDKMSGDPEFISLVEGFYNVYNPDPVFIFDTMDMIAERAGVHPYTAKFVYYACLSRELPAVYEKNGISLDIMHDSLADMRYKLFECLEVYGIPGFFAPNTFYGFYILHKFKLGRLEFCVDPYLGEPITIGDYTLNKGDRAISIHIPSSGEKFDKATRYDAYDRAYYFFRKVRGMDVKAFTCHTWLLNPDNKKILPEKSNIVSFIDDFRITFREEFEDGGPDMWRIFGADGDKPYDKLPRDNSLRRAIADWLAAGNKMGRGEGVFLWDPVKKCTVV